MTIYLVMLRVHDANCKHYEWVPMYGFKTYEEAEENIKSNKTMDMEAGFITKWEYKITKTVIF